tara:strand:- start:46 stop:915 length:870 start_codon:yes stop_codon:yes gene_type:complete
MSSNKYVLNPDGSITKKSAEENGTVTVERIDAATATNDQIRSFDNFESLRTSGGLKGSTAVNLPLLGLNNSNNASVSFDEEYKLYNAAFGSRENYATYNEYYNQFNTIFTDEANQRKVYAEELEILAGFDVNSIGIFSLNGIDLIKFNFILDYILESVLYVIVAELIIKTQDEIGKNVFYTYFYDLLNYPKFNTSVSSITQQQNFEPIAYFLVGLNEFINTDPKLDDLIKNNIIKTGGLNFKLVLTEPNNFLTLILNNIADNIFSLSKIEHNRISLLIRKFQKESYWHK